MAIVFAAIVLRHRDLDVEMETVPPELAAS
jgi:hypothetical protein